MTRRGGGGLVTALRSLVTHHDVTWIASAMSDEDKVVAEENGGEAFDETWRDGSPYRLRLVVHDPAAYDWYYNVVSNPTLWFLQHYMWGLPYAPDVDLGLHTAWFNGYLPVNEGFAAATVAELEHQPDAAVFFHDYHLYLAPRLVRERRPDALTTHFIHIPWPEPDYWPVLPGHLRVAVHEGAARERRARVAHRPLAAQLPSLVRRHPRRGSRLRVVVGRACRSPHARDEPSDRHRPGGVPGVARRPERARRRSVRSSSARPEFLVVRVDRTDPSKNVVRGFRAFALFLDMYPEMHGRATLLALLDPSRQDIPEYSEYLAAIQREARTVNDRFQNEGWLPIDLQIADNFAQAIAAYKQYDALLVNPVFDGLNLVSKEAPLVNGRDGVLILSENAGSHEELGEWALTVNPFDVYGQAQTIHEALTMEAGERRQAPRGDSRARRPERHRRVDRPPARRSGPRRVPRSSLSAARRTIRA